MPVDPVCRHVAVWEDPPHDTWRAQTQITGADWAYAEISKVESKITIFGINTNK